MGLVVPSLAGGGGVLTVASFLKDTILATGKYDLKVLSLATSMSDNCSVSLLQPLSWRAGVRSLSGTWEGIPYIHIGSFLCELEFQRFKPRRCLSQHLGDCDVVQVVCGSPAWAYALRGLGKPVSLQCATRAIIERRKRDAGTQGPRSWFRKGMTHVTNSIECNVLRFVDAIQVENRWMYEFARQHNPDRDVDIRFLQPGIDTGRFRPKSGRDFHRDPYVLCVGRLNDSRKNVGLLLEAYAKLSIDARRSLRLVLAGLDGPPKAFWKRAGALGLLDRIQFIRSPSNDDLLGLYQGASMFALTSDEEGFGMVILEAMSCGIPVISTRSGGPDDIITDGSEGFLVPVEDTAALADRIARLHFNVELNLRMGHCARLTIQNRYATDVAGKPFVEVWDRLLATKVYR